MSMPCFYLDEMIYIYALVQSDSELMVETAKKTDPFFTSPMLDRQIQKYRTLRNLCKDLKGRLS